MLPHGVKLTPAPDLRAFGWGDDPSTQRCLAALAERDLKGKRVADVGGGTGIIGLRAALDGAEVTVYEQDPALRELITRNAEANGVMLEVRGAFPEEWDGQRYDVLVATIENSDLEWSQYADDVHVEE